MDPTVLALAVLSALAPYAKKGAEAVAAELGKKAVELGSGLVQTLRARWGVKQAETDVLDGFLANPEGQRDRFAMTLVMELSRDAELHTAIEGLLSRGTPEVNVRQNLVDTDGAVGAVIREVDGGIVNVHITSQRGTNIRGVEIDRLGGGYSDRVRQSGDGND